MKKATRQQTKEHNRNLVLKTIIEHDSISRAEIARITSLTRTTVSDLVADLLAEDLVSEVGVGSSLGGKSPILLSLVEDSRYMIGLDLGQSLFRGAVVNLRGAVREMISLPVGERDGAATLARVYEILDRLVAAASQPLVGIGVGTPGLVDTREGVVINAVNLDWQNLPLARLLEERYHLPAYVLNDSQAAAIAEYTYGEGNKTDGNLVVINARHGIGAGIVINGRLFQGDGGGAGEIGHVVVVPENGLPCRCGNRGCLETVASAQALVKRGQMLVRHTNADHSLLSQSGRELSLDLIEEAFQAGDELARQLVLEAGRYMGAAISNLIGTLNIHKIVLVGDMTRFGKPWLDAIAETVSHAALVGLVEETTVEIGKLEGNGILLGASALLANNYMLLFRQRSPVG
jgi:glucokinase-like ROK family protein